MASQEVFHEDSEYITIDQEGEGSFYSGIDDELDDDEISDRQQGETFARHDLDEQSLENLVKKDQNGCTLDLSAILCNATLPKYLFKMYNINELDLKHNELSEIPDAVSELHNLKIFDISNNSLRRLPSKLRFCTYLEVLKVQKNQLTTLPSSIGLKRLKQFYCQRNKLNNISEFLENTKVLELLNCSYNPLDHIPPLGTKLTFLAKLYCQRIGLQETPLCLTEYKSLELLDVSQNVGLKKMHYLPPNIQQLYFFSCFKTSKHLDTDLVEGLRGCNKLLDIGGWDNKLKDFPRAIFFHDSVTICNLSNNKLTNLPDEINRLKNLEQLILSNNLLIALPESLCELEYLKKLQIERNNIENLPLNFYKLNQIGVLGFEGNPWRSPPIEVLRRGILDVQEYFLELKCSKSVSVVEQKVILLGDSEAGKTSLTNALKDGKSKLTKPEERTVVLELHKWQPEQNISYQLNDFGGHDIYQVTHPFFLNEKAIHLLLFDTVQFLVNDRSEMFHRKIIPWLMTLQDIVPGGVVLLVGTHIDKMTKIDYETIGEDVRKMTRFWILEQSKKIDKELQTVDNILQHTPRSRKEKNGPLHTLDKSQLEERKKRLVKMKSLHLKWDNWVYLISAGKSLNGVNILKRRIIQTSTNGQYFPYAFRVLPESWYQLIDHITSVSKLDILQISKVREIAKKKFRINGSGLETALRYLHDVGRILWYSEHKNMDTIVFHKVIVLVELLKALFRHDTASFFTLKNPIFEGISKDAFGPMRDQVLHFGNVAYELLECLWGHFNFGQDTIPKLCELLEKFNLCYRFDDDTPTSWAKRFIHVPWLLEETESLNWINFWPKMIENDHLQLQIEFHFDGAIPNGFYEKSSVALHEFTTDHISKWKHGLMAKVNQDNIHLERDQPLGKVILATRSSNIASGWKTIHPIYKKLKELLGEWPGKHFEIYEICPHCLKEDNEPPAMFPYETLEVPPPRGLEVKCCPTDGTEMEIEYIYVHPDAAISKKEDQTSLLRKVKRIFKRRGRNIVIAEEDLSTYRVSSMKAYFSNNFPSGC